jgi:hypothetical protein
VVYGAPQIMSFSIYFHKHFVQVPSPIGMIAGGMKSLLPDLAREQWTKSLPLIAHGFMTNVDAAFMEKIFDVAKGQRKPDIHHHSQA